MQVIVAGGVVKVMGRLLAVEGAPHGGRELVVAVARAHEVAQGHAARRGQALAIGSAAAGAQLALAVPAAWGACQCKLAEVGQEGVAWLQQLQRAAGLREGLVALRQSGEWVGGGWELMACLHCRRLEA